MNAPLRRVAISVLVLFTLLIVNVNYIQVVRAQGLRTDPGNTRVLAAEYDRQRGSIVVAGNEIALSTRTNDQLTYLRQYPQGPVYAPVTGYYSVVYGNTAIERAENDVLSGSDPRLFVRRLADLFTGRNPSGGDVVLTLDPKLQQTAMSALGNVTGAVVALDPGTGKILALASTPSYDPNQLSSHDPAAIQAYANQLSNAKPDPRSNQATTENYPPGSVFKTIVSAAALSNGYTPDTPIPAPNLLTLPQTNTTLSNYNGESCNGGADQKLIDAFTISCNTAFAQLGMTLGEDKVRSMAEAFGMNGKPFSVPIAVAGSSMGQIDSQAALGQASIGQRNVRITALQGAMIAAAVANGGRLMTPYLVDQIRAPDLTVIDQSKPEEMSRPISSEVDAQLTQMMVSVVASPNGTGRRAAIPGVQVAGKTGTAEVSPGVPPHTWFVGFAPADHPRIAVAVFVANGGQHGTEGTTGGDISAPIAKQVMQTYLGEGG